jgi:hypothetical protein
MLCYHQGYNVILAEHDSLNAGAYVDFRLEGEVWVEYEDRWLSGHGDQVNILVKHEIYGWLVNWLQLVNL